VSSSISAPGDTPRPFSPYLHDKLCMYDLLLLRTSNTARLSASIKPSLEA